MKGSYEINGTDHCRKTINAGYSEDSYDEETKSIVKNFYFSINDIIAILSVKNPKINPKDCRTILESLPDVYKEIITNCVKDDNKCETVIKTDFGLTSSFIKFGKEKMFGSFGFGSEFDEYFNEISKSYEESKELESRVNSMANKIKKIIED